MRSREVVLVEAVRTRVGPATRKVLQRNEMTTDGPMDCVGVNEAWKRKPEPDVDKVNAHGGGRPLGATGARPITTPLERV